MTGNFSLKDGAQEEVAWQQHGAEANAACSPRYFMLNTQVLTLWGWGLGPRKVVGAVLTWSLISPDGVHHPHHGFCLRLPP